MPTNMLTSSPRTAVERLLDDPIFDPLLARDGLTRADVLREMEAMRAKLRATRSALPLARAA